MNQSELLLILLSNILLKETILYTWALRIPFLKDMMADSKIFSKKYMTIHTNQTSSKKDFGMNTDLLMIWLHKLLNLTEDLFGHAKTMMVMFNQILSPKVTDLLVSWLQCSSVQTDALRLKLHMEQSLGIIECTNKVKKQAQTQLLVFLLGLEVWLRELN